MRRRLKRPLFSLAAGIALGAITLLALGLANHLIHIPERRAAAHAQENLESALCPDETFARTATLTVYPATEADMQGSFAYNGIRWYELKPEGTKLLLLPGEYTLNVASSNRVSEVSVSLKAGEEAELILSAAESPQCPEFLVLEARAGYGACFELDFASNCEVQLLSAPEGVSLLSSGAEWSLAADASLDGGYYPFILALSRPGGKADVHMALKIPCKGEEKAIASAADLLAMRDDPGGCYYLAGDIDLSEFEYWPPLFTETEPFSGCLDGRGYEIRGLKLGGEELHGSLLGYLKGAQLRSLIIREPSVREQTTDRGVAALAYSAELCLIENCAVLGGSLVSEGVASGMISGAANSHLLGLFNSAEVFTGAAAMLPNTGGIIGGANECYIAFCANEGRVRGHHLTGGISGFAVNSVYRYCLNSGQILGIELAATYAPGGIIQSSGGGSKAECLFVRGQSPLGAGGGGPVFAIGGITRRQLYDASQLSVLGTFYGEAAVWGFASEDAEGPVPLGIFSRTCEAPEPVLNEKGEVNIPEKENTVYYYTLDGSDPRVYGAAAESLSIEPGAEQLLTVFAACSGAYDSETICYGR